MIELTLENAEWGDIDIEVRYSSQGIENITVDGREPKGHEVKMINMSIKKTEEEVSWAIHQDAKETEYDNRMFAGRAYA